MQLLVKKKSEKKKCINLFNPAPDIFNKTFPPTLITTLKEMTDYWRPTGDIGRLMGSDYFFRELLQEAEILITGWGTPQLPFDLLQTGQLKYICHVTGSIRRCIEKKFLERGYVVTNWGNAISHTIAESALLLILACLRRLKYVSKQLEAGYWDQYPHQPLALHGQRVGLLGFGAVAQDLVTLLKPFKVRIQAYDPYLSSDVFQRCQVQRITSLKRLFSENDIISLHAGMTEELTGIVNQDLLALMADNAILINTAQGQLIEERDLLAELEKGRLWCGLDVFAVEPLPADSPFRFSPRCVITPHSAGPPQNCYHHIGEFAVKNIRRYLRGEPLLSVITPAQYDRMT